MSAFFNSALVSIGIDRLMKMGFVFLFDLIHRGGFLVAPGGLQPYAIGSGNDSSCFCGKLRLVVGFIVRYIGLVGGVQIRGFVSFFR